MDFANAFPNSKKVYIEGRSGIRVPVREISLSGGEPPLRVYDTSGPHNIDVSVGLPKLRADWIAARGDTWRAREHESTSGRASRLVPHALNNVPLRAKPGMRVTQLHYARRGEITPEMEFIALREGFDPDFVRSEVARRRAIIPANINHPEIEPMIIGRAFKVKINA